MPAIRGGATVMDTVFGADDDHGARGGDPRCQLCSASTARTAALVAAALRSSEKTPPG